MRYLPFCVLFLPGLAGCSPNGAGTPRADVNTTRSVGQPAAAGPIDGTKLLGVWKFEKALGLRLSPFSIEFRKGDKYVMTSKTKDQEFRAEGIYMFKNNELTLTKAGGKDGLADRTVRVTKLTDDELVYTDYDTSFEFRRAK
ncbi:MAG TPA: hypothetical protein VGZ47_14865 [Gemmataceae bacterium]|nr:hypothetical protein [Gemmataceae bacterium]